MFKEKESLDHWFICPDLYIGQSDVHGVGVFTSIDLPKGRVVEISPVILSHSDLFFEDLRVGNGRHVLTDYLFHWADDVVAFPLGWAGLYNHETDDPNCTWKCLIDLPGLAFVTKKKIKTGEELCTRYVPVSQAEELWFEKSVDPVNWDAIDRIQKQRISLKANEIDSIQKRRITKATKRKTQSDNFSKFWVNRPPTHIDDEEK